MEKRYLALGVSGLIAMSTGCTGTPDDSRTTDSVEVPATVISLEVRAGVENHVALPVLANATCVLGSDDEHTGASLELMSADEGIVTFDVTPKSATKSANLVIHDHVTCVDDAGKHAAYNVQLRATTDAPLQDLSVPKGRLRPALTGDLLAPTQVDLLTRGYPMRPDPITKADAFRAWAALVSRPMIDLTTTARPSLLRRNASFTPNWAGVVDTKASSGSAYLAANARWTVPESIPDNSGTTNSVSFWVGVGGYGTSGGGMWQGGTAEDVIAPGGSAHSNKYPWAEFINASGPCCLQIVWGGLPIARGDQYEFQVMFTDAAGTPGIATGPKKDRNQVLSCTHINYTRGWQASCTGMTVQSQIDLYRSVTGDKTSTITSGITGATAEWIVERPSFVGGYSPLPNFGVAAMTNAQAFDRSSWSWGFVGARPRVRLSMQDAGTGHTLATGDYGPTGIPGATVGFNWVNYR